jgi:hypothetical protein
MGEYAGFNGEKIKIGTCESMYYLRFEDRSRVTKLPNNLNPSTEAGLFFRLPFPDEDEIGPGSYPNHNRGYRIGRREQDGTSSPSYWNDWRPEDTSDMAPGLIQLHHESGLLLNVQCHHGVKLPEVQGDAKAFWNGKGWHFELSSVKHLGGVLKPVFHCRWCQSMWSCDWEDVLPFCGLDAEMLKRLEAYAAAAGK